MTLPPKLSLAVQRLQIADVLLKSIAARLENDFVPMLVPEGELAYQFKLPVCRSYRSFDAEGANLQLRKHVFEVFAALRFVSAREGPDASVEAEPNATIESEFLVFYDEKLDDECLDEESIGLYAQSNVPFSVWPYWREVVQSACGRMGLPRVVLPTHRLHRPQPITSDDLATLAPPRAINE